jgi:hypothetical protein
MSPDLQSEADGRGSGDGSPKVFAVISACLMLAVAAGVTRGALHGTGGSHVAAASASALGVARDRHAPLGRDDVGLARPIRSRGA